MKKLLALLLALCMIFAFTACGQSEEEKQVNDAIENLEDATENGDLDDIANAMDDLANKVEGAGQTIAADAEDIVDTIGNSDEFKNEVSALKVQGLTCKLEARDNYLVYVYSFTIDIADIDGAKAAADSGEIGYKSMADSLMKVYTGIDGVIIEYTTADGEAFATYKYDK